MKVKVCWFVLAVAMLCLAIPGASYCGPAGQGKVPPPDHTLMAFKEIGVWYFPCFAPIYHHRIPAHYQTYGPPPPPCGPVPCGPPYRLPVKARPLQVKVK